MGWHLEWPIRLQRCFPWPLPGHAPDSSVWTKQQHGGCGALFVLHTLVSLLMLLQQHVGPDKILVFKCAHCWHEVLFYRNNLHCHLLAWHAYCSIFSRYQISVSKILFTMWSYDCGTFLKRKKKTFSDFCETVKHFLRCFPSQTHLLHT